MEDEENYHQVPLMRTGQQREENQGIFANTPLPRPVTSFEKAGNTNETVWKETAR